MGITMVFPLSQFGGTIWVVSEGPSCHSRIR